ncbi:MAG: hypothetical protein R3B54_00865 [Bdellovibrionota bacterium]
MGNSIRAYVGAILSLSFVLAFQPAKAEDPALEEALRQLQRSLDQHKAEQDPSKDALDALIRGMRTDSAERDRRLADLDTTAKSLQKEIKISLSGVRKKEMSTSLTHLNWLNHLDAVIEEGGPRYDRDGKDLSFLEIEELLTKGRWVARYVKTAFDFKDKLSDEDKEEMAKLDAVRQFKQAEAAVSAMLQQSPNTGFTRTNQPYIPPGQRELAKEMLKALRERVDPITCP